MRFLQCCIDNGLSFEADVQNSFRNNKTRTPVPSASQMKIGKFRQALPQFIAVSVKNTLLFVYGMTLGFPTIVIPAIQGGEGREPSDIVLSREEISWFGSINLICVPLGCVFSGALSHPFGKRTAMQIVNVPILISWLIFHFSTKVIHLYIGLCLFGISGGLMETAVLTYVAEITEPKYRGLLSASGSACVVTGVFIQFVLGSMLDWRTVAAVCTVFPVISLLALFFIPESPTWLIHNNKLHKAIKALQWLRGWVPEYVIEDEFNCLYNHLNNYQKKEKDTQGKTSCSGKFSFCKQRIFIHPFALVAFCFFIAHFSGKTPLQTYAVQIFHTLKAPLDKYHATILMGLAEVIGTVLCVVLVHFTGKRPLVFISAVGVGFCFFGTATYAYFLNIVPGFAINNVVVNASHLVPKDSIITTDNLTQIFKDPEDDLLIEVYNSSDITVGFDENSTITDSMENSTITFEESDLSGEFLNINDSFSLMLDLNETDYDEDFENSTTDISTPSEPSVIEHPLKSDGDVSIPENILVAIPNQKPNNLLWLPLVLLLGVAFFAHVGIRLIPWFLIGEVFPASIRGSASGFSGAVGYGFGFLVNKLFLQMLATLTLPGTFWFYSFVAFFGFIVLYFVLPETEGRTLADIEEHFAGVKSCTDDSRTPHFKSTCSMSVPQPSSNVELSNFRKLEVPPNTKDFESNNRRNETTHL